MLAQPLRSKVMEGLGSNEREPRRALEERGRASSSAHSLLNCGIVVLDEARHDVNHFAILC